MFAFYNIHARLADGFDHNGAFGLGHVSFSCFKDVILPSTGAGNPDDTVLAFDCHLVFAVIQAEKLV
jgi:hypothetical protein